MLHLFGSSYVIPAPFVPWNGGKSRGGDVDDFGRIRTLVSCHLAPLGCSNHPATNTMQQGKTARTKRKDKADENALRAAVIPACSPFVVPVRSSFPKCLGEKKKKEIAPITSPVLRYFKSRIRREKPYIAQTEFEVGRHHSKPEVA